MSLAEKLRIYLLEPAVAGSCLSVFANIFGVKHIADFAHVESHDALSLLTVLLGASLALWIGLFWIASTPFGQWLSDKKVLVQVNAAYIVTIFVLLSACVAAIICAYVPPEHHATHMIGAFLCVYGLLTVPATLNNTHKLLKLHGAFGRQQSKITQMPQANLR